MDKIDIYKLLRSKSPRLARWIPRPLIALVGRVVCVDRINDVLSKHDGESPLEFIDSVLREIGVSYVLHGVENIPADQRLIFAANHPLGGLDGLILARAVDIPGMRPVKLIVNDLLMNLEPLAPIFAPVNKHGTQSSEYARGMVSLFEGDDNIITFPAGLCSRLIAGQVTDPPWRRNFVIKAWESGRCIIPVYISGRNSMFFYRLAKIRKALGVKVNIEMFFLPQEMFNQRGKRVDIYFGTAIVPNNESPATTWSDTVRAAVYDMGERASETSTY